jgi:hypothetical protein
MHDCEEWSNYTIAPRKPHKNRHIGLEIFGRKYLLCLEIQAISECATGDFKSPVSTIPPRGQVIDFQQLCAHNTPEN